MNRFPRRFRTVGGGSARKRGKGKGLVMGYTMGTRSRAGKLRAAFFDERTNSTARTSVLRTARRYEPDRRSTHGAIDRRRRLSPRGGPWEATSPDSMPAALSSVVGDSAAGGPRWTTEPLPSDSRAPLNKKKTRTYIQVSAGTIATASTAPCPWGWFRAASGRGAASPPLSNTPGGTGPVV